MAKRSKRRRVSTALDYDRHHLLFQGRHWSKGYAKLLREAFVRPIPVKYHRELHAILHDVPLPHGELVRDAWEKYLRSKNVIDGYPIERLAAWLYVNIPDTEFRKAIQTQIDFFVTTMGGSS